MDVDELPASTAALLLDPLTLPLDRCGVPALVLGLADVGGDTLGVRHDTRSKTESCGLVNDHVQSCFRYAELRGTS